MEGFIEVGRSDLIGRLFSLWLHLVLDGGEGDEGDDALKMLTGGVIG